MNVRKKLNNIRLRRSRRVRSRIRSVIEHPRLSVFRSHRYTTAQIIDDMSGTTLAAASSMELKKKSTKIEGARYVGKMIAERGKAKNVTQAVLDRGSYHYHGRIKEIVEEARKHGLKI
ncbi:50S ribosomal protein L18 [Candidatus Jorgensenbacteria bacterium]|nr:50S ribosomal protein L18 [Candidatus Jorgensenbacteria bacterium]